MKMIKTATYEEMSEATVNILLSHMSQEKRVNLSITAGNSPKKIYEMLIPKVKNKTYYEHVHYYNFDEVPVEGQAVGLTMSALNEAYFEPAAIQPANIHPMTTENYQAFPQEIADAGGLDLMLIGIGADGHFCANMPGTTRFHEAAYRIDLTQKVAEPWYEEVKKDLNTDCFVTLGAKSLMRVRHLVLIANGQGKAEILKQALNGPITPQIPASILQLHPNFTVITDAEAGALLKDK
ncbi:glucosamine-6-phosphate deaminase [Isobaculum melis]|uniref:6-phosphogluconolactonase/Glucosamine-6-phosphate isomerase/deaminase n=1 Tax=Isobaculum melis TaxID=142588 RepID=A0A1H9R317_9LACT|nr:glucosamine-6-phosphate deaminase [Isobaculum melis]SER67231.1 6-phosphogluconolactonase/Glucosamine-6-phosphateisomerase/deaminase [Isobaculum melis]